MHRCSERTSSTVTTSHPSRQGRSTTRVVIGLAFCLLLLFGVFRFSSKTTLHRNAASDKVWRGLLEEHFAGDDACQECHPAIYAAHQRSGHARTMLDASDAQAVERFDGITFQDPRRGYTLQVQADGATLKVGVPDHLPNTTMVLDWILGSGGRAQTALSLAPERELALEHRWTVYQDGRSVGLTPAHDRFEYDPQHPTLEAFGRPLDWNRAVQCLGCHSTFVPPQPSQYSKQAVLPNVGCERCHGPRKEHVLQAKLGRPGESAPMLQYHQASNYLEQCAQCHRGEAHLEEGLRPKDLVRFQPLRLKQSPCFIKSSGEMTCSTCHDPHDAVSRDAAGYRTVCLSCHSGGSRRDCPEPAVGNCIDCHMQKTEWEPGIYFHDHRIARPEPGGQ